MNESPERPEEVFRGHFEECLKHFLDRFRVSIPKSAKSSWEAKRPLAEFCNVEINSVGRWLNGELPIGERRIRLMCYLDTIGYRIIEFERLPKSHRGYAELIGFGIIPPDEAALLIGYKYGSHLFQIFNGKEGTSKEKDQKMWDVWKAKKAELEQKRSETRKQFVSTSATVSSTLQGNKKLPLQEIAGKKPEEALFTYRGAVVSIMEGLLGLMPDNFFEELSARDLVLLQRSATTMLKLSARLSVLGSQLLTTKVEKGVGNGG